MFMRRRIVWIPLVLAALLAAVWGAAWYFIAGRVNDAVERWLQQEAQRGRTWNCANRGASGFPFALNYNCDRAALIAVGNAGKIEATLRRLEARYNPLAPMTAQIRAIGPLLVAQRTAQARDINVQWDDLTVTLTASGLNAGSLSLHLAGKTVQLRHQVPQQTEERIDLARLDATAWPKAGSSSMRNLQLRIDAKDISAGILERGLGVRSISELESLFEIENVQSLVGADIVQRLRTWREAQGVLQIQKLRMHGGRLALEADGRLQIDGNGFPAGNISARAAGATALLQHMGMARGSAGNPGILGRIFRGPGSETAPETGPGRMIPLPLLLRDGYFWIGPVRTPAMVPRLIP